jgi:hypothetical protein
VSASGVVRLERSGGFAGLTLAAERAITELPAPLQTALVAPPPTARTRRSKGADQYQYVLTVPVGRRVRTYRFGENEPPAELAVVVDHLASLLEPTV